MFLSVLILLLPCLTVVTGGAGVLEGADIDPDCKADQCGTLYLLKDTDEEVGLYKGTHEKVKGAKEVRKEQGTEVLVITPGKGVTFPLVDFSAAVEQPTEFCGAKVVSVFSFGCPFYPSMPMSFCLSPRVWRELQDFKPDVIHCCSPGVMVWAGKLFALMLNTALVLSYHTHIPKYAHKYGMAYLEPALWNLIKFLHRGVDLTLVTSHAIAAEFEAEGTLQGGQTPEVWRRGVDSDTFNPAFKSAAGRAALLGGAPDDSPLIVHIGRLGFEKNLEALTGSPDINPLCCQSIKKHLKNSS